MIPITPPAGTNTSHGMYAMLNEQYRRATSQESPFTVVGSFPLLLQINQEDSREKPLTASIWEILHG